MRNRQSFWIGILISAVFLILALRAIEWSSVLDALWSARLSMLLLGLITLAMGWWISAVRWRLLLAPAPGLRIRDTFAYIMIGMFANTVLPLRLGEVARATLIGRKKQLGISRTLGTMALERVLDVLMLVLIMFLLTFVVDMPRPVRITAGILAGGGLAFLAVMTVLAFQHHRIGAIRRFIPAFVPDALSDRLLLLAEWFVNGVTILKKPSHFGVALGLSAISWSLAGLATTIWIYSFGLEVPWYAGLFVLVIVNLGSAIPSSPGYVGVYEFLCVFALTVWVEDRSHALAYAIGTHALNMSANVGLGSFFLAREGVSLRSLKEESVGTDAAE